MADKKSDKKGTVLRRGMAEPDWAQTDAQRRAAKPQPFRWDIPRELQPGAPVPTETPAERTARWAKRLRLAVAVIVVFTCLLFIVQSTIQGFDAQGVSMEPTLHNGDRVVINKAAYAQVDFGLLDWAPLIDVSGRWATPSRGDIVVFRSPVDGKELVKRVVGMPGEWVTISSDVIYINGERLDEPYAVGDTTCSFPCNWEVPEGQYFMLGDNRENSLDSREGWSVPLKNIDGKKLFAY